MDLATLGADVIGEGRSGFTMTRLHARYDKSISDDLWFREASPITGGRELEGRNGELEKGAQPAQTNNFQARYVIRHPWKGPIACANPTRNVWGGKPGSDHDSSPPPRRGGQYKLNNADDRGIQPATNLAFAPRTLHLATAIAQRIPELDINPAKGALRSVAKQSGCGCDGGGTSGALLLLGLCGLRKRRR